jgi:TatD DNase family protein
MIDTHAHIYLSEFDQDRNEVLDRAANEGIVRILMPNIDFKSIDSMLLCEQKNPNYCVSMMGLHPCSVSRDFQRQLYEIESWLGQRKFAAVGEIGLDLFWDKTLFDLQKEAFRIQCELAVKHALPIVIHSRDAVDESIELIKPYCERGLKGVFHCFSGSLDQAITITGLGFSLGIGGVVTFKNGGLDKVLPEIGLEYLILETDSPYLAPVPFRGKRNEPMYTKFVCSKVADLTKKTVEEIDKFTTSNAVRLFELMLP